MNFFLRRKEGFLCSWGFFHLCFVDKPIMEEGFAVLEAGKYKGVTNETLSPAVCLSFDSFQ